MKKLSFLFFFALLGVLFTSGAYAQPANSITFNGTNQYMRIPNHADFQISPTESFSVSLWVKNQSYNYGRFVNKRLMTAPPYWTGYELWNGNTSNLKDWALNTPYAAKKDGSIPSPSNVLSQFCDDGNRLNQWIHIGFTVDRTAGKMYMYENGVLIKTSTNPLNYSSDDTSPWRVDNELDVLVGVGHNTRQSDGTTTLGYYLKGAIGNLRFWDKALSAAEMSADMTAQVTAETPNLLAGYDFKNYEGKRYVTDVKGNHPGELFNFPIAEPTIATVEAAKNPDVTGRGNENELLVKAKITVGGTNQLLVNNYKLNITGTQPASDLTNIKIFTTGATDKFDVRKTADYTLVGSFTPVSGELNCDVTETGVLQPGVNYIWIAGDIKADAPEGNKVGATLSSITYETSKNFSVSAQSGKDREILLVNKLVFAPGDYGSTNYRIPALAIADDGAIVTVSDRRKFNENDLPQDIDLVVRRSYDGGKTWTEPLTLAQGTGLRKGFGDAAIVKLKPAQEGQPGKLLVGFVGGEGFFDNSSSTNPINIYTAESTDNGVTWTTPRKITDQIYGSNCTDPVRKNWQAAFISSGAAFQSRSGRIMFTGVVRKTTAKDVINISNYIFYSDDQGATWNVSGEIVGLNGNEAKVVELNDGTLLASIRNQSAGYRYYSKSTDNGVTWSPVDTWGVGKGEMNDPGCNGDIIRYTSTKDGYNKNRLLHSVLNNKNASLGNAYKTERKNVSVFLSYDEGATWALNKSICESWSAYSSLAILPDGTIGIYYEKDPTYQMSLYFANFSLAWLTDGADTYTGPTPMEVVADPVFSVPSGEYFSEQTVAITCATEGATIHYTTDGSVPTATSPVYTEALHLSETVTLKAIALKDGMSSSAIVTATYTFKTSWNIPTGTVHPTEARYITSATTTGANTNLSYAQSTKPTQVFVNTNAAITSNIGDSFTLHVKTTDMTKWCHAIIFIDWNRNFSFDDDDELIAKIGLDSWEDANLYKAGNTIVNDFTQPITIPSNAFVGETRMRIQLTDAWHDKTPNHTHSGEDVIDKGGVYDFILNINNLGTGFDKLSMDGMGFYPNPANDYITIENASEASVYTLDGKMVLKQSNSKEGAWTLNVGTMKQGIYILKLTNEAGTVNKKLIKQ